MPDSVPVPTPDTAACSCGHPLAEHYANGCGWCICKVAGSATDTGYIAECPACFMDRHKGHDLGLRHEGGSLYSATCHNCGDTFHQATEPMRQFLGGSQ